MINNVKEAYCKIRGGGWYRIVGGGMRFAHFITVLGHA